MQKPINIRRTLEHHEVFQYAYYSQDETVKHRREAFRIAVCNIPVTPL
jgi:hypothetical protein